MKQFILIFCVCMSTISFAQISSMKANDFELTNPMSACKAGGTTTITQPQTANEKWQINLTINTLQHKHIMGEITFANDIPSQIGSELTTISDIINITNISPSAFVLQVKAINATNSNYSCSKPGAAELHKVRYQLIYQNEYTAGEVIQFSINATDHGAVTPVTDEILVTLTVPASLSIDKLAKYDFSFGPNPTEDFIYLSASKNIGNVEIFNLVGQKSLSTDLRASKGTLDISNLSKGVYIMNVTIDENIGTYKIIKQ